MIGSCKDIKFLYLNARSIVNKLDEFRVVVDGLGPDVIGVTESWASSKILDQELAVTGYVCFRTDRQDSDAMKGGGVLLYVREELSPVEVKTDTWYPEHVWCRILDNQRREILIGVCYRTTSIGIFDCDEHEQLQKLLVELDHKSVILMGDFNYGGIEWNGRVSLGETKEELAFRECLEDHFYVQNVNSATRDRRILDLVISNEPGMVEELEVIEPLANNDHNMITWSVSRGYEYCETGSGDKLDYKRADFEGLRKELREIDWKRLLSGGLTEDWITFRDRLLMLESKYVPVKKFNGSKRRKEIWISNKAIRSVNRKRKVFRKYRDRNHPACKAAARKAAIDVRDAKLSFETKLADNIKYDSKSFFAYVRSKSRARIRAGSLLSESGVLIEKSKEKADEFNRYFSSVFSRENLGDVPLCDGRSRDIENGLEQIVITEERVRKVLRSLRGDKSPGVDGIGPRLLVHMQDEVCLPISILFNKSMSEGEVPEDWRRANIVPIFKAGSRNKPENFRPVSLTSQVCKLFESLMREDIVDHLRYGGGNSTSAEEVLQIPASLP